jgi:hypothetical protein
MQAKTRDYAQALEPIVQSKSATSTPGVEGDSKTRIDPWSSRPTTDIVDRSSQSYSVATKNKPSSKDLNYQENIFQTPQTTNNYAESILSGMVSTLIKDSPTPIPPYSCILVLSD